MIEDYNGCTGALQVNAVLLTASGAQFIDGAGVEATASFIDRG
jgi:hypothetical protein